MQMLAIKLLQFFRKNRDNYVFIVPLFNFLLAMYGRKSIVLGQIFEIDILMNLHVLSSIESENLIFNGWSVCVSVISII